MVLPEISETFESETNSDSINSTLEMLKSLFKQIIRRGIPVQCNESWIKGKGSDDPCSVQPCH